uniref:Hikeshi-like domain-containing protein n=1 Tax=Strombidium rassoulzadegani TaxID=1082188 RepID=A0A7S3CSJ0_9SPIT|mmetsp:Transcript_7012/g.11778  ORF Transcript_7012/g.11778 Transcript_7012/m.11778 type:complete len:184 (+) Transcript_7012:21-572(+)
MENLPPFGIIVPGLQVSYNYEQFGDMFVLTVPNPGTINVVSFFLNQPIQAEGMGAALYYSAPPNYDGMTFVGAIANDRPSDIFHTGFSLNPDINQLPELKLIVQLKGFAEIQELVKLAQDTDMQKNYAKKVAINLFNYLKSFDQLSNQSSNLITVPLTALDKWFEKFSRKYDADPNFVYKSME